jgi:hypothetical protein
MNSMLCHSTALLRILRERVPRHEDKSCFIGFFQSVRAHAELVSGSVYTTPAVLLFLSVGSARVTLLRLVRPQCHFFSAFPDITGRFFFKCYCCCSVSYTRKGKICCTRLGRAETLYTFVSIMYVYLKYENRCGLVARVSGYRFTGPGLDSRPYQIF